MSTRASDESWSRFKGRMLALCLALQEQTNDYPEGLKGPNVEGEYSCKWPDLLAWLQDDNLAVELSSEKKLRKNRYQDIKITFAGRAPTAFFYSRPELFKELPPPEDPKTDLRRATSRKRKNVEEINENGEENQDIIHKNVSRATVYRLAEQVSYQDLACTARDRLEVITNFNARAQVAILLVARFAKELGVTNDRLPQSSTLDTAIVDSLSEGLRQLQDTSRGGISVTRSVVKRSIIAIAAGAIGDNIATYFRHSFSKPENVFVVSNLLMNPKDKAKGGSGIANADKVKTVVNLLALLSHDKMFENGTLRHEFLGAFNDYNIKGSNKQKATAAKQLVLMHMDAALSHFKSTVQNPLYNARDLFLYVPAETMMGVSI